MELIFTNLAISSAQDMMLLLRVPTVMDQEMLAEIKREVIMIRIKLSTGDHSPNQM